MTSGRTTVKSHIIDFDFYSVDIFNRCENSNDVLMAVQAWEHVHPFAEGYSRGVGSSDTLWSAPFSHPIGNGNTFSVGNSSGIASGSKNRVITHEYKLMNESRLLWKPRFFILLVARGIEAFLTRERNETPQQRAGLMM